MAKTFKKGDKVRRIEDSDTLTKNECYTVLSQEGSTLYLVEKPWCYEATYFELDRSQTFIDMLKEVYGVT